MLYHNNYVIEFEFGYATTDCLPRAFLLIINFKSLQLLLVILTIYYMLNMFW